LKSSLFIINPGPGIEIGFESFHFMFNDLPGDLAVGIIQVSKFTDASHTGCNAGRFFSFFNKTQTKAAFFDIALFLNNPDVIGTGHNAILTADALIRVYKDDPILPLIRSPGWTDLYAGRVVAMLALDGDELPVVLGERAVLPFFQVIV
jgi:hypothetical protein